MSAPCVQINMLHPKDVRTNLFYKAANRWSLIGGSFALQLFHFEYQLIGRATSEGAAVNPAFSKSIPTSTPKTLLAARAARILIFDPKCPEDSHASSDLLEELVHTVVNGNSGQGGVWAVVVLTLAAGMEWSVRGPRHLVYTWPSRKGYVKQQTAISPWCHWEARMFLQCTLRLKGRGRCKPWVRARCVFRSFSNQQVAFALHLCKSCAGPFLSHRLGPGNRAGARVRWQWLQTEGEVSEYIGLAIALSSERECSFPPTHKRL